MPKKSGLAQMGNFLVRHRISIQDLLLVVISTAVAAYVAYDLDIFVNGSATVDHVIEADELPLIGAVLCVGLLLFAWRRSLEQKRETRKRIKAEAEARELAMQDPLTGLANRRQFMEALGTRVSARSAEDTHAVLCLDLNGFKQINDVHGHGAGDDVLREIALRLERVCKNVGLVARVGGDEFCILVTHLAGPEAAAGVALRIIETFSQPISTSQATHIIGTGIGIAMFPFDGANSEEVLRRADVALYKAKVEPHSASRFFDEAMDRHVRERERMERGLRLAITQGDIQPYFQPLVDLKTNDIIGFEALARWHHQELGNITPDRFITIAEETGLIHELAQQLLIKSCTAAREWPQNIMLAFNISAVQLKDRLLPMRIMSALGETGLSPHRLELEITENALVRDLEAAKEILGSLHDAGVRIALDDFGTGYSSLYHLTSFKVDKIKIDRSFVQRMHTERESAEIVSALVGLGHGLNMTVIAEGIEDADQAAELVGRGCDQGQGFLFSRAVSAADALALFKGAKGSRSLKNAAIY